MISRDPSVTVSPSRLSEGLQEALLRPEGGDLFKVRNGLEPLSRRGRTKFFDSHLSTPSISKFEILISKQIPMTKIPNLKQNLFYLNI
jgi:hypothetical protein